MPDRRAAGVALSKLSTLSINISRFFDIILTEVIAWVLQH